MKENLSLEKEEFFRYGNISLILDSYDDLFSDFDPRGYEERALSEDFLSECKRASRDKPEDSKELELRLLVPGNKRNEQIEETIKKRLHSHFTKHHHERQAEKRKIREEGALWILIGTLLTLIASSLLDKNKSFIINIFFVILEPAGWFSFWTGLDRLYSSREEKIPDLIFYKKMSKSKISFFSY